MTDSRDRDILLWELSGKNSQLLRIFEYLPVSTAVTSSLLIIAIFIISFVGMIFQLLFSGDWMLILATILLLTVTLRTMGLVYLHDQLHEKGAKSYYQLLLDIHHTYNAVLLYGIAIVLGALVWYSRFTAIAVVCVVALSIVIRLLLGDEGTIDLTARTVESGEIVYPLDAISDLRVHRLGSIAVLRISFDRRALRMANLPGFRALTVSMTTDSLEAIYPVLNDARQRPVGAAIRQGADPPETWQRLAERFERPSPGIRNRWERVALGLFGLGFMSIGPFLWMLIPPSSRGEIAGVIVYIGILMAVVGGGCLWYALRLESRFYRFSE